MIAKMANKIGHANLNLINFISMFSSRKICAFFLHQQQTAAAE